MTVNITPFFDLAARTALRGQGRAQQPAADDQGPSSGNLAKRSAWQREMERAQFNAWFLPFDGRTAMNGSPLPQASRPTPAAAPGAAGDPAHILENHEPQATQAQAKSSAHDVQRTEPSTGGQQPLEAEEGGPGAEGPFTALQAAPHLPAPSSAPLPSEDGQGQDHVSRVATHDAGVGSPPLPTRLEGLAEPAGQLQGQDRAPTPAAAQPASTLAAQGAAPQATVAAPPQVAAQSRAAIAAATPMAAAAAQTQPAQTPEPAGRQTDMGLPPSPAGAFSTPAAATSPTPISAPLAGGAGPADKLAVVVRSALAASLPQLSVPPRAAAPLPEVSKPGMPLASPPEEAAPAGLAATESQGLAESAGPARAAQGLPSSPRENLAVRLHAQWEEATGGATAHVWLGMDGSAAQIAHQVAIIIPELQRQLAGQGQRLGRVVCNGQLVYDPADAPAPTQVASFAHALVRHAASSSTLDSTAGREALAPFFSPTPQEDS